MAKEYAYYIEGNNLALLEYDEEEGRWDSPSAAVTNGFIIEYTKAITDPTTYSSSINVSREIAQAIVYYLKWKMVEDKDIKKAMDYRFKFYSKVRGESNRKVGSARRILPKKIWSVR